MPSSKNSGKRVRSAKKKWTRQRSKRSAPNTTCRKVEARRCGGVFFCRGAGWTSREGADVNILAVTIVDRRPRFRRAHPSEMLPDKREPLSERRLVFVHQHIVRQDVDGPADDALRRTCRDGMAQILVSETCGCQLAGHLVAVVIDVAVRNDGYSVALHHFGDASNRRLLLLVRHVV